ncbi:MAG TPA: hypothetical protein VNR90_01890 [Vicinamibacterales bacterium]|nr:hypothetical protein [Vicinamibacterales bacterium]
MPRSARLVSFALTIAPLLAIGAGCAESPPLNDPIGLGGSSAAKGGAGGGGDRGGTTGSAGSSGAAGTVGSGGAGGASGTTGSAGRGGTTGGAGAGGRGGTTGTAGTAGSAGASGRGGTTGTAGASGRGGTTGTAGTTGSAGRGGTTGTAGTTGSAGRGGTTGAGGTTGTAGTTGSAGRGGTTGAAGTTGSAGTTGTGGSGGAPPWNAGNPNGSCASGVPAMAQAASTSSPTAVIGTGSAASCTFSALQTAVTAGGVITFNCGPDPVTIRVTATLKVPSNKKTVIDGGRKITLDGGGAVQIMSFISTNFQANDNGLTLQHIAFTGGKTTPTEVIPTAPAPCSQGYNDGEGGALYMRDGYLVVVDSIFTNNVGAPLGPDTGGGAIYVLGSKGGVWISGSTFTGNHASNAGAVGGLFAELNIYNSLFQNNKADGHDANSNDPSMCSAINNDQNEIGSGGNGGAIYSDGNDVDVNLCGDAILTNAAGTKAFGGGLFFTSNNFGGDLKIADTTMTGNTGGRWTQAQTGSTTNAGTAVGTNCHSVTITNSTIQGLNGVP